ncbi:alpha/beta hydrolase family protein [Nannocystis pusilla]|uniref:alpha/beta hydrolase family protein n=1 Tax=Nannocystis pusilla TaxID=889268 RepID=UPI003B7A0B0E
MRPLVDGRATHFSFASPYRPRDPGYAREYATYDRVDTVHLHAWQHDRPAPASILLAHGWCVGNRRLHEIEFSISTLYRDLGLDVYLYVQPFHSLRKPTTARFSGELFPSTDLVRTNEAFIQTVQDVRAAITAILRHRPAPLGMMGSSLGGYTSALVASIDPRLSFVVPIMAPASFAHLFWDHGEGDSFRRQAEALGMTRERFHSSWALHSPSRTSPRCRGSAGSSSPPAATPSSPRPTPTCCGTTGSARAASASPAATSCSSAAATTSASSPASSPTSASSPGRAEPPQAARGREAWRVLGSERRGAR